MAIATEMRLLSKKWQSGTGWPKRLNWIEVSGLRGWNGQRVELQYPITAIVGENGSGKSTLLQAAACVYRSDPKDGRTRYASEFFPDTAWDQVRNAGVRFGYTEGGQHPENSIRKKTTRWLGNVERPVRRVDYIDLTRIQPVSARTGYAKIAKTKHNQASAKDFTQEQVGRLSAVMGRTYDSARMALTDIDAKREVPVISKLSTAYSGFHQGSGETTIAELLQTDLTKYSLVLIDEIESSLHPRAQRRLIRDLAERCRDKEIQIILSTHSPYVLEELPFEARKYILETGGGREIVTGVSPQFAMTKMDDETYPEIDLYVEDQAAKTMLSELLAYHGKDVFPRCQIIPFGAASVGHALGQMVDSERFPRPSLVYLDGDNASAPGCLLLPGGDAPEQVVFMALRKKNWGNLWSRIGRDISLVDDACQKAMTLADHHEWVRLAANQLKCGGDTLWQAMCAEWAAAFPAIEAEKAIRPIEEAI
jgi:predicted ATPase